jgi:putative DNA primase/helicase
MKEMMTKQMSLKVTATTEDQASGEFFATVEYLDIRGGVRSVQVPLAELTDPRSMKKLLVNAGAYLSDDDDESMAELRALKTQSENVEQSVIAPALGWYGNGFVRFLRPEGLVGTPPEDVKLRPPRHLSALASSIGTRGTHEEWVETVAKPAARSTRMVLTICSAFAAPLLKLVDMSSFAIYLTGESKIGKSTATLVAGSVIGFGTEEELPNFRTTNAAFDELLREFNDNLMPINEFGLLEGNAKERRQRQRELAYGSAEGCGKTYSRFVPTEKSGKNIKRHSIIIANGEETSDEVAMEAGESRMAGEGVRWIDLPAVKSGDPDIFDMASPIDEPQERSTWYARQCAMIRQGCKNHHGKAQRHFLKRVIRHRTTIRADLVKLRDEFTQLVTKNESEHVVQHLAKNFGHIYAAGILAVRFGTVPWSEDLVLKCIRRCYRGARREIKSEADLLRGAVRRLRVRVADQTIVLTADQTMSRKGLGRADGYRGKGLGCNRITVRAEAFKAWFDDPRQPRLVLEWLRTQHCLPTHPKPPKRGRGIVWAGSQPQWPDGARRRSVVIDAKPDVLKKL